MMRNFDLGYWRSYLISKYAKRVLEIWHVACGNAEMVHDLADSPCSASVGLSPKLWHHFEGG